MQPVFTGHLSAFDLHTLDLGEAQIRVGHLWDAKWNRRRKRRFLFTIFLQPRFYSVSTRAISSKQNKLPHLSLQNCFLLFVTMIPVPRNSWCFFLYESALKRCGNGFYWVILPSFFFMYFFSWKTGHVPSAPSLLCSGRHAGSGRGFHGDAHYANMQMRPCCRFSDT